MKCHNCGINDAVGSYVYCAECYMNKIKQMLPPILWKKWEFKNEKHKKVFQKFKNNNLYIYGPAGSGKTIFMGILAKYFIGKGYNILFVVYPLLITRDMTDVVKIARFNGILFLDDVLNDVSNKNYKILYTILNTREINGLPIVMTSNYNVEDMKTVGDSISSRIIGLCKVIDFSSNFDMRGE